MSTPKAIGNPNGSDKARMPTLGFAQSGAAAKLFSDRLKRLFDDLHRQICSEQQLATEDTLLEAFEELSKQNEQLKTLLLLPDRKKHVNSSTDKGQAESLLKRPFGDREITIDDGTGGAILAVDECDGLEKVESKSARSVRVGTLSTPTAKSSDPGTPHGCELIEIWPVWQDLAETNIIWDQAKQKQNVSVPKDLQRTMTLTHGTEEMKALLVPWYIMLPSSNTFLVWNLLFMTVLFYDCVTFPLTAAFNLEKEFTIANIFAATFWTCDFIVSFLVAFDTSEGFETRVARIAAQYARTWMIPDLVVVIVDWLMLVDMENSLGHSTGFARLGKAVRYLRILRVLRVLRLRKLREVITQIDELVNSQQFSIAQQIMLNMVWILLLSHFIGCGWYALGSDPTLGEDSWVKFNDFEQYDLGYRYLTSIHWAITQFTPGSMSIQPQNSMERLYSVAMLMCGMIVFSSTVSSITAAANSLKNLHASYEQDLWILRRFFREQNISRSVVSRVLRYTESIIKPRYQRVGLGSVTMLSILPTPLNREVYYEIYQQHVTVHPLFEALVDYNLSFLHTLCKEALKDLTLDKAELFFIPGQVCSAMHFVADGVLVYFHTVDMRGVTVGKRRCFCEAVLWTNWIHQGRMFSRRETTIISLDAKTFHSLAQSFADFELLKAYAREFVFKMNELAGNFTIEEDDDVDLSDLLQIDSAIALLSRRQMANNATTEST